MRLLSLRRPNPSMCRPNRRTAPRLLRLLQSALLASVLILAARPPATAARHTKEIPVAVRSVNFVGNQMLSAGELRDSMELTQATFLKRLAGLERIEYDYLKFQFDLRAIRYKYQKEGFIRAEIVNSSVVLDTLANAVDLRIELFEGEQYRFGRVGIEGATLIEPEELWRLVEIRPEAAADLHLVKRNATAIRDYYRNRGFVLARVEFDTATREADLRVDVSFSVSEGLPHSIGAIQLSGNHSTRARIVRREMRMEPGALYNLDTILADQRNLYNTGLFSGVKISEAGVDTVARWVNMRVELIERRPRWISIAVGSSTNERENFRLSGEWGHKNLFGTARLVTFRALATWQASRLVEERRLDPIASRLEMAYLQPWIFGFPVSVGGTIFTAQETPIGREKRLSTTGVTARLLRRVGADAELYLEPKLQWANESIEGRILDRDISQTNSITLAFRLDSRENVFAPRRGIATTATLTRAGGQLSGDFDFWRATTSYARFWSTREGSVVAVRLSAGGAEPYGRSAQIPLDQVFSAGGASTVRGYLEGGLGTPGTPEEGGRALILTNLELRQGLIGNFGLTPFVDGAQVWPRVSAVDPLSDLRWTMGLELRYQTPIGPIRVGYGTKLNPAADDDAPGAWFFGFGQVL